MRLFIGLALSPEAAEDTARIAEHVSTVIPGRYVPKRNYHMTLAFLGSVPDARLNDVRTVVDRLAGLFGAPRLTLGHLAHFRRPENAVLIRTVFSCDPLDDMHTALLTSLKETGLPFSDDPFSPHVTIARHANLCDVSAHAFFAPNFCFTAPCATLFLSARNEDDILCNTPLYTAPFTGREKG